MSDVCFDVMVGGGELVFHIIMLQHSQISLISLMTKNDLASSLFR